MGGRVADGVVGNLLTRPPSIDRKATTMEQTLIERLSRTRLVQTDLLETVMDREEGSRDGMASGQTASKDLVAAQRKWAQVIPDLIDGIGPPGDFGYDSKRGRVLHSCIRLYDVVWRDCDAGRRANIKLMHLTTKALEELSWPKDVRNRLPKFYVALSRLQDADRELVGIARSEEVARGTL